MNISPLRLQVVLFGSFDEINPSTDNIKFLVENFSDKGFIPSQFNELSIGIPNIPTINSPRLSLTSTDSSWNIMFGKERLEVILTNINVDVYKMPDKELFISTFNDTYKKIYQKFPKNIKRIGFVFQYLIRDVAISSLPQNLNIKPSFFDKSLFEFSNRYASKRTIKIPHDEIINIIGELTWIKNLMTINSKNTLFNGLLLNLDINTILENSNYRLNNSMIESFLSEVSRLETELVKEYTNLFISHS
jgi:hypothetical protein